MREGAAWRRRPAAYAAEAEASRGRRFAEPPSPTRSPFQRDCDRIVHATAFRRLKGKTQVFLAGEGDHYRTRLTHTLEVTRIARDLARPLGLEEDLTECIALAHDLGHPPFGHAGERALNRAMAPYGGFDHNLQSLRIIGLLERRYPAFDGLNLSFEVLEGLAKHNGPGPELPADAWPGIAPPPPTETFGGAEAQVAAIADDIAYDAHDLDDGVRAGLIGTEELDEVDVLRSILRDIRREYPGIERSRMVHELSRRLITFLVEDVGAESERRLSELAPRDIDAIRNADRAVVAFSPEGAAVERTVKGFLTAHVYRHPEVASAMAEAGSVVEHLFAGYFSDPSTLPPEWRSEGEADDAVRARRIADYLAGQTDRFAIAEAMRLFDGPGKSG